MLRWLRASRSGDVRKAQAVKRELELLLRLRDEDSSVVSPFAFLRAAERYNLMPTLDRGVVRTALAELAADNAQEIEFCSIHCHRSVLRFSGSSTRAGETRRVRTAS